MTFLLFVISACNWTCQTCSSSTACLTCRNGLMLNHDGHCVSFGYCSSTEYYVEKTQTCKPCHRKCFHCSGPTEHQCLSCANNHYLLSKCLVSASWFYSTLNAWNRQASVTFMKHVGPLSLTWQVEMITCAGLPGNSLWDWACLSLGPKQGL